MQVAICDDDYGVCGKIEEWVTGYSKDRGIRTEIHIYNKAEDMFAELKEGKWLDIIFLDIELPGISGIQMGKGIREKLKNDIVSIVFISGKTTYCPELFDIQPFNFHEKPLNSRDIISDLDKFIKKYTLYKTSYTFRENGVEKGVDFAEIMYFSVYKKEITLVTVNGQHRFKGYLSDIEKKLPETLFCRCHKSYIVNMNYVKMFKYNEFLMMDGSMITVGRNYREHVKKCQFSAELR